MRDTQKRYESAVGRGLGPTKFFPGRIHTRDFDELAFQYFDGDLGRTRSLLSSCTRKPARSAILTQVPTVARCNSLASLSGLPERTMRCKTANLSMRCNVSQVAAYKANL